MKRRGFLYAAGALPTAFCLGGSFNSLVAGQEETKAKQEQDEKAQEEATKEEPKKPEQLDPEMVRSFVGQSHGRFDGVKELFEKEPRLVLAAWDWGKGDWETGLGAASHVGNRAIAEYLIDNGARVDQFAIAMLGMEDLMAAYLKAMPNCHQVSGPHGITLLSHAIYGKEKARGVLTMLLDAGADVNGAAYAGMSNLMAAVSINDVEIVELLLEKGADPGQKNANGETALDQAKKRERTEIIAILEKVS